MKFFIFCLLFLTKNIAVENEYDFRALIILGHSDFQITKDAYAQEFLNVSINVPNKNAALFAIFHSDETFLLDKHFDQTFIQSNFLNKSKEKCLVIVSTKGTNEMSLEELQLFREMIYYLNGGLIVLEIGKSTTQTSVILEHSTFCWGKTSIDINVPNTVILCNGIKTTDVPFLRNSKISTIFDNKNNLNDGDNNAFVQAKLITWPNIFPSAMAAEQNFDKKRGSKKAIQTNQRELYYKSDKKTDENIDVEVDEGDNGEDDGNKERQIIEAGKRKMKEKMLKRCRWRKSCLETGQIPELKDYINFNFLKWFKPKMDSKISKNNHNHENHEIEKLDDNQKKYKCRYRPSCYAKNNIEMSDSNKKKSIGVLTSKSSHFKTTKNVIKKKTVKELAHIAIKNVEEKTKKIAKNPKAKISKMEKHLNEMEEKLQLKIKCHYRKSCIQSNGNVKPEIDGYKIPKWLTTEWIKNTFSEKWSKIQAKEIKPFEEQNLEEKKLHCKYRKSCFETGKPPKIEKGTNFRLKHVVDQAKNVVKVKKEQACRYRKSCYETGVLPSELQRKEKTQVETKKPKTEKRAPITLNELKLHCKYRPSCYREKVEELEHQHVPIPEIHIKQGKEFPESSEISQSAENSEPKEVPEPIPTIQVEDIPSENPEIINEESINEIIEEPPKKQKKLKPKPPKLQEETELAPPVSAKKSKKLKKPSSSEIEPTENFQEEVPSKQKKTKKVKSEEVMEPEIIQENKKEEKVKHENFEIKATLKVQKSKSSEIKPNVEIPKVDVKQPKKKIDVPKVEPQPSKQTADAKELKARFGDSFVAKALHFFRTTEKSKKIYTAEEWEHLPLPQKQLYCKYRKHCLETGKIPKFGPSSTQTIRENPKISIQQKCHWRKSCIAAIAQHNTDSESQIIDEQALPINKIKSETPQKSSEKQKTTEKETTQTKTEKKQKKSSSKSKSAEIDESEEKFKEIPPTDSHHENIQKEGKHLAKNMSTNVKLALKYRLSAYVFGKMNASYITPSFKHNAKCSKYRLSCREQLGLPPIEKVPIGPNGKKLCRKKIIEEKK